jgi:hypothetical protein
MPQRYGNALRASLCAGGVERNCHTRNIKNTAIYAGFNIFFGGQGYENFTQEDGFFTSFGHSFGWLRQ